MFSRIDLGRASNLRRARVLAIFLALLTTLAIAGCGGSSKPASSPSNTTAQSTSAATTQTASSTQTVSGAAAGSGANPAGEATLGTEPKPGVVTASAQGLTVTLHAGTHSPRVNAAWPISFTATRTGQPVRATLAYEYLFAGAVVGKRPHKPFTGHAHDVFRWPASAVGYPLTFRAVLVADGATFDLDYAVKVER